MNAPKSIQALALVAAALAIGLSGCKSNGNSELLERELRCQEDRIYQLEDELDDAYFALETSRRENQKLKDELGGGDRGAGGQFLPNPRLIKPRAPKIEMPDLGEPQIEMPDVDARDAAAPGDEAPPFRFVPKENATPTEPDTLPPPELPQVQPVDPGDEPPKFEQTSHTEPALTGDGSQVVKLVLNRRLTGGWNPNHKYGDEGVFVAFEPRDASNQLIAAPGSVSIAAIDPALTGGAARVGRWDFTTDEAAAHFRTKGVGRGYQFELPWPSEPPVNSELRLFVRFETANGRRIEADTKIHVTPCDGWSTKATDQTAAVPENVLSAKGASGEPTSRVVKSESTTAAPSAGNASSKQPTRTAKRPRWSPER